MLFEPAGVPYVDLQCLYFTWVSIVSIYYIAFLLMSAYICISGHIAHRATVSYAPRQRLSLWHHLDSTDSLLRRDFIYMYESLRLRQVLNAPWPKDTASEKPLALFSGAHLGHKFGYYSLRPIRTSKLTSRQGHINWMQNIILKLMLTVWKLWRINSSHSLMAIIEVDRQMSLMVLFVWVFQ